MRSARLTLWPVLGLLLLSWLIDVHARAPQEVSALTGVPTFEPDPTWPRPPKDWSWGQVIGIFADSRGHVWTSSRSQITEWDPQGALVQSWDARGPDGNWSTIHGLFVDHSGHVWTNARESHLTIKFTRTGEVALVIGKFNETGGSNDTSLMGRPSEIWVDPADNEVFIADGYGNRRIVVFDGNRVLAQGDSSVQRLRGFLDSSAVSANDARLTYLVASGAPNDSEQLFLGASATPLVTNPFFPAGGGSSDRAWS